MQRAHIGRRARPNADPNIGQLIGVGILRLPTPARREAQARPVLPRQGLLLSDGTPFTSKDVNRPAVLAGEPRFWVVTAGHASIVYRAAPHRITVTLKRAAAASFGYSPSSGQGESTHGWDRSVPYEADFDISAPASEAPRGWDEGDRP